MQHFNRECLMVTFIENLNTHGMITSIRSALDNQFEAYLIGLSENLKQWPSWVGKSAKRWADLLKKSRRALSLNQWSVKLHISSSIAP
jgi:hypothetical protein